MGLAGQAFKVHPESWRWVLLAGGAPALLGILVLGALPESPQWLARPGGTAAIGPLFRPPLWQKTLLGIALGTIPLFGAWGSSKWLLPWADQIRGESALTQTLWAAGATVGSLSGGWLASCLGRRRSYCLISLGSLLCSGLIYRLLAPGDPWFLPAVLLLGVVSTSYFGWLPLFLPELFPVSSRATGMGVSYNFGRFATAAGVLGAGALMQHMGGSYGRVGSIISLVYGFGMVVIWLIPAQEPARQPAVTGVQT
jgi:MFS family permease